MADATKSTTDAAADVGYVLTVRHAFLDYQPGDKITDAATIQEILAGDLAVYVIMSAKAD